MGFYNLPDKRTTDTTEQDFNRSDRFLTKAGMWYFRTREGKDVGPFRYREEAELMLTRFTQELIQKEQEALAVIKPHFRVSAQMNRRTEG